MKLLSNQMLHAVLLLAVLGYSGWSLYREAVNARAGLAALEHLASGNNTIPLVDAGGIDIGGKHITNSSHSAARSVVFLLRSYSLVSDVAFWDSVSYQIARRSDIELIGFCDGNQCVKDVRRARSRAFPVIACGNARDIQAVLNADANGQAYILEQGRPSITKVAWRVTGSTVQKVVEEITK